MGKDAGKTMKFLPKEECTGVTTILFFFPLIDEVVIGRRLQIQVLETGMIPKQEATFLNFKSEFLKASWGWVMLSPHLAKLRLTECRCIAGCEKEPSSSALCDLTQLQSELRHVLD